MSLNSHNMEHIQSLDRENYEPPVRTFKDNVASGRKHLAPKHAFGDIKNVIHNQSNLSSKGQREKATLSAKSRSNNENETCVLTTHNLEYEDSGAVPINLEYIWSEKSVFFPSEFDEKVKLRTERKRRLKEENWERLEKDLLKSDVDVVSQILSDENKINSVFDHPIELSFEELPLDDSGADFLNW